MVPLCVLFDVGPQRILKLSIEMWFRDRILRMMKKVCLSYAVCIYQIFGVGVVCYKLCKVDMIVLWVM